MKSRPDALIRLRTTDSTSTTGPHVRDWQNCGVANARTNGLCAASAWATDVRYRARSGCRAVVRAASFPPVLASVGVFEGIALSPTDGALLRFRTTTLPSACTLRPPTGWARNQYVPGVGASNRVT